MFCDFSEVSKGLYRNLYRDLHINELWASLIVKYCVLQTAEEQISHNFRPEISIDWVLALLISQSNWKPTND